MERGISEGERQGGKPCAPPSHAACAQITDDSQRLACALLPAHTGQAESFHFRSDGRADSGPATSPTRTPGRCRRRTREMAGLSTPRRSELVQALDGGSQGTKALRTALQAEPGATSSIMLVEGLTQVVSCFRPEWHAALVDAVLSLHWQQRSGLPVTMARAVLHFVQELVSAAPAFLRQCIAALVHSFLPVEGDEPENGEALGGRDEVSALVHVALESILCACPVATDYVFESLKTTFPHKRREALAHAVYVRHCIAILRYSPALMKRVVGLLVARMVELDVEIALQQRHLEDAAEEEDDDDEPIFEVDLGDNMSDELAKMRKNANKLDGMMALMFEFIAERCGRLKNSGRSAGMATPGTAMAASAAVEPAEDMNEAERLLHALLVAFHESVLYTYKCRCVQFLLFFACSFSERFTSAFTNFLLRQVSNEQVHAEARIASAAYIASFLARASFVPLSTVLPPLHELLRWAEQYQVDFAVKLGGAPAKLDVALHGVFYAVMQGCLYLLCYKNAALSKPEVAHERDLLGVLVGRIVAGRLNPLKFCQDAVLIEFERCAPDLPAAVRRVARWCLSGICSVSEHKARRQCADRRACYYPCRLGLVPRCADIVAANEGTAVDSRDVHGGDNRLDDFFPFDPLLLKVSSGYVDPLYQIWAPRPRHSERESRLSETASDTSDVVARSLQDMSLTPGGPTPMDDDLEVMMMKRFAEQGRLLLQS